MVRSVSQKGNGETVSLCNEKDEEIITIQIGVTLYALFMRSVNTRTVKSKNKGYQVVLRVTVSLQVRVYLSDNPPPLLYYITEFGC